VPIPSALLRLPRLALAPAAACLLALPSAADAFDRCRADPAEEVLRSAMRPVANASRYRLVDEGQYRLATDAGFRLADDGQYRLNGLPRCLPPVGRSAGLNALPGGYQAAGMVRAGYYHSLIQAAAQAHGLQPELLHAVITVESGYNPKARSPKGAQGLMQLMPGTAARFSVSNAYDPAQNVAGGSRYLSFLLDEFDNDLKLALAAYNAGEEAVRRYRNSIPPYPETRAYVRMVLQHYRRLNRP
jgi:soluble lytic murein transglycosylase-like protein